MTFPLFIFNSEFNNTSNILDESPKYYTNEDIKNNIMTEIQPRDFNIIDHKNNFKISSLIIRKTGYIIKLSSIRCIITSKNIYLFNAEDNNTLKFKKFFKERFKNNNIISSDLPFEFRFLEIILIYICNQTDITINELSKSVHNISLENVKSSNLTFILSIQNKLIYAEQEYSEMKTVISDLMKSEEDMFNIYLSKKSTNQQEINKDEKSKIDEFEILLENYHSQINEDISLIKKLIKEVEAKLRLAEINLADFRNRIAVYNTHLSIYSISISIGSFFAAIFGMNLKNSLEGFTGGLYITTFIIIIIGLLTYKNIFNKLKEMSSNIIYKNYNINNV